MRSHTPLPIMLIALFLMLLGGPIRYAQAQPSIPIDDKALVIDGRLPETGFITRSPDPVHKDLLGIEMLSQSIGLIQTLEPRAFVSINRLARPQDPESDTPDASDDETDPVAYLHISRRSASRIFAIRLVDELTLSLIPIDAPELGWTIRREAFVRLKIELTPSVVLDPFAPTTDAISLELPKPHTQSQLLLDPKTVRSRIRISFPRLTRELGDETFRVRLPKNYDPSTPAGVLVWISPTPDGRIPQIFGPVCDRLGLIAVGVDSNGNKRAITDRLQNHLDSIETLSKHAIIDRQRVYLTGMSGGGRCSGILQLAFPEHFAGAVPIVGLDTYHNAPTGTAGQFWPKRLGKPNGTNMRLLKDKRIRSITGSADFNEPEMTLRTQLLNDDGINAKIDVIEGMAHTMPSARQFTTALDWVDEPRRDAIDDARIEAQKILDETGSQDASLPAVRRRLIGVIEMLPYSEQAWEAAARLGHPKPAP